MTLQTSGAISLANIQTEFGGSNPISLSEYYGKGGVTGSGQISIGNFYGTSNYTTLVFTVTEGIDPYAAVWVGFSNDDDSYNHLHGSCSPTTQSGVKPFRLDVIKLNRNHYAVAIEGTWTGSDLISATFQSCPILYNSDFINQTQHPGSIALTTKFEWTTGTTTKIANSRWDGSGTSTVTLVMV
jgi:hypothetical protein